MGGGGGTIFVGNGKPSRLGDRILVTGAYGFLGRHVCAALYRAGAISIFPVRHGQYDLLDRAAVRLLMNRIEPEVVIHLAASVGGIGANQKSPGRFCFENSLMGLNVIEEARLAGVEKLVCVGTCCSYPKYAPIPFAEESLWQGHPEETNAPYGVAKRMLLTLLQAYREEYSFNGVYLIPSNMYGPGDSFDAETSHVIPALIRKFSEASRLGLPSVTLWGTGLATREFLFVKDCASAIVQAVTGYDGADPVNLGTGEEIRIGELAEKIASLFQYEGKILWDDSRPDGQPRRCLNAARAGRVLGWAASTSLDEGLRETIAWYEGDRIDKLASILGTL
jgi:GDP-L-fucose synthase